MNHAGAARNEFHRAITIAHSGPQRMDVLMRSLMGPFFDAAMERAEKWGERNNG